MIQPHVAGRRAQVAHRRKADTRIVGDDDHVAEPCQFRPDADAGAVHLGDDRLVHVEQLDPQPLALLQPPHVVVDLVPAAILRPRPEEYSFRSAPAQKCGPAPRSTTQWTGLYSSASFSAAFSSRSNLPLSALRRSGRFSVTMAVCALDLIGDLLELHCFLPSRGIRGATDASALRKGCAQEGTEAT